MTDRQKVVDAARSWIGTPYHHHGKIKGVGCDCVTMIVASYVEAGVLPASALDIGKYAVGWHLHHEEPLYEKGIIGNGGHEITDPGIGDMVLYEQAKTFAHGGIISRVTPLRFVHAFLPARRVIEGDETEFGVLVDSDRKFYSLW